MNIRFCHIGNIDRKNYTKTINTRNKLRNSGVELLRKSQFKESPLNNNNERSAQKPEFVALRLGFYFFIFISCQVVLNDKSFLILKQIFYHDYLLDELLNPDV